MDSPLHLTFHYPSFFQHLQVCGNGRLGRTDLAAKCAGAASLALRQHMNHGTPGAVRQGVKGKIEGRTGIHSQLTIYWPDEISNTENPPMRVPPAKRCDAKRGVLPGGPARIRKYTDDTHSFVSSASLQGLAERPVPCKYNVIQFGEALSRRKRGFESLRGRQL